MPQALAASICKGRPDHGGGRGAGGYRPSWSPTKRKKYGNSVKVKVWRSFGGDLRFAFGVRTYSPGSGAMFDPVRNLLLLSAGLPLEGGWLPLRAYGAAGRDRDVELGAVAQKRYKQ